MTKLDVRKVYMDDHGFPHFYSVERDEWGYIDSEGWHSTDWEDVVRDCEPFISISEFVRAILGAYKESKG